MTYHYKRIYCNRYNILSSECFTHHPEIDSHNFKTLYLNGSVYNLDFFKVYRNNFRRLFIFTVRRVSKKLQSVLNTFLTIALAFHQLAASHRKRGISNKRRVAHKMNTFQHKIYFANFPQNLSFTQNTNILLFFSRSKLERFT